jgi:hypothetical protein
MTIAKFHAIGDEGRNAKVIRERPQHRVEQLADQHNLFATSQRSKKLVHGFAAKLRFQHIMKVFFAKEVEAVLADAAQ